MVACIEQPPSAEISPVAGRGGGRELAAGWRLLLAGSLGTGSGLALFLMTASLFLKPLSIEFGASRAALSIGPMVLIGTSFLLPLSGVLVDRWGSRPVALLGLSGLAIAFLGMALMPLNLHVYYALAALVGVAGPMAHPVVFTKPIGRAFNKNMGTALGITLSGTSVVSLLIVPPATWIIAEFGWRSGYLLLAGAVVLLGLVPVLLYFHDRPQAFISSGPEPASGKTLGEATRDRRFWLLLLAFVISALPIGGVQAHIQPMLSDMRIAPLTIAALTGVFMAGIGVGRIGVGLMLDRAWPNGVAGLCFVVAALATFFMASGGAATALWATAACVFMLGFSQGSETDFNAFFMLDHFGLRSFSRIFGVQAMCVNFAVAVGGIAFSMAYDRQHSYVVPLQIGTVLFLAAAALMVASGVLTRNTSRLRTH